MNIFRRHLSSCAKSGSRTGQKCPAKPPCPIHVEGLDGQGKRVKSKALIDPRTGSGVRDWARACEVVRDLESPSPRLENKKETLLTVAVDHFLKLKSRQAADTFRKNRRVTSALLAFLKTNDRACQFVSEVRFCDLTDFCSSWQSSTQSNLRDLGILASFFKFCHRADFAQRNLAEGLFKTLNWQNNYAPKEPFSKVEIDRIWEVLPNYPDEYGRLGGAIAQQTAAFIYLMRYTGMDVSTTMMLPKARVRGNQILTYRLKNGSEVWTIIPDWVVEKLWSAPHDSDQYFFWTGSGKPHTRASKWFSRLRKLLDLAGLQHRTPHNFRHHFAVEHLLNDTPIEDVSRLLGHANIGVTIKSYAAWVRKRQQKLEEHQRRVWHDDSLHQRMILQL